MTLRQRRVEGILCLTLDTPPVNALDAATRQALLEAIETAATDPSVLGVLLGGAGQKFSAGADITEFGQLRPPSLPQVIEALEALEKPVLALIEGLALGGGFELALGAHIRLATPAARFGLPEIKLGLLPGAGGTQRLPRLIGADAAIEMMVSGRQVDAAEALDLGIVDAVCGEDAAGDPPREIALAALAEIVAEGSPPPRLSDSAITGPEAGAYLDQIASWRQAIHGLGPASLPRIVDCVEAALLLPFQQGLGLEGTAFQDCLETSDSRALRHMFLAERMAMRFARAAPAARVAHLGLIGAGRTGAPLAAAALAAGLAVSIRERDAASAGRASRAVARTLAWEVERGRVAQERVPACLARLTAGVGPDALGTPDLVIECVEEDPALKARVLAEADAALSPKIPLGTTSSWSDPATLAAGLANPERVFVFHPAPPAARSRLVEIASAPDTAKEALATAARFVRAIGRTAILVGPAPGYLVNRLNRALRSACDGLLEAGATPDQVDAAFRAEGFPAGPYQALDREGLDYAWNDRRSAPAAAIPERLIREARFGRRSGGGYYDYREDGRAVISQAVLDLIEEVRTGQGIAARDISDAEIVSRGIDALANEGFRALDSGLAASEGDIDVACHHALGMPRTSGGPMFAASLGGLPALVARLRARAPEAPALWSPAAGLLAAVEIAESNG